MKECSASTKTYALLCSLSRSRGDLRFWLLLLVAISARLFQVFELRTNNAPDHFLVLDPEVYVGWAQSIVEGDFLGSEHDHSEGLPGKNPVFFRPPLYPYFLALLLWIFSGDLVTAQLVQGAISALVSPLTYLLGTMVGMSRRQSVIAGLVVALYGPLVFLSILFLSESIFLPLIPALLIASLRMKSHPSGTAAFGVGLFFGAAALVRSTTLLFAVTIGLWLAMILGRRYARRLVARWALLGVMGLSIPMLAVTVRNYLVGGELVVMPTYGGYNFYAGNNRLSRHGTASHEMMEYDQELSASAERLGRQLTASEVSRAGWDVGLRFARQRPTEFLLQILNKLYRVWSGYEIISNQNIYLMRMFSDLLSVSVWHIGSFGFPFGLLAPLGLLGTALAFRHDRMCALAWFIVANVVVLLLFFVTYRHRAPMIPILVLLAVHAVSAIHEARNNKRRILIPCLCLFMLLSNTNLDNLDPKDEPNWATARFRLASSYYREAAAAYSRGDFIEGERVLRRAITNEPTDLRRRGALAFLIDDLKNAELPDTVDPRMVWGLMDATKAKSLDAMAAAQAEAGRYTLAVRIARQAVEAALMEGSPDIAEAIRERLYCYEQRRPYAEPEHRVDGHLGIGWSANGYRRCD